MNKNTQVSLSEAHGPMQQLLKNLAGKEGREWLTSFNKFLRKENPFGEVVKKVIEFLRPAIIDEKIILDACDGNETIADAKKVFTAGIDNDFNNFKANETGAATEQTEVKTFDLVKNATISQIFCSFNTDLNKLCLTHKQIINFCKKFKQYFSKTGATLFLFKAYGLFFVAYVRVDVNGSLRICVDRFDYHHVWNADHFDRVVVPQQIS